MDYKPFTDPNAALEAIQDFMRSNESKKLPQDVQDRIWKWLRPGNDETGTSVSFVVAYFAEIIYARKEDIDSNDALRLAASCAAYGQMYNVDNLGGARGGGIIQALRRRSGERAPQGQAWIKADDDPKPRITFVKDYKPEEIEKPAEEVADGDE
jgi:hypothetical protein